MMSFHNRPPWAEREAQNMSLAAVLQCTLFVLIKQSICESVLESRFSLFLVLVVLTNIELLCMLHLQAIIIDLYLPRSCVLQ